VCWITTVGSVGLFLIFVICLSGNIVGQPLFKNFFFSFVRKEGLKKVKEGERLKGLRIRPVVFFF